jgi:hypothetical protein
VLIGSGSKITTAKLSFKFRPYRSTSSFAGGSTGGNAAGESGHSHSHAHSMSIGAGGAGGTLNMVAPNGPLQLSAGGPLTDTTTINNDATGSSGHSHSHSHTVGGSSLGVSEGSATTIAALAVDGVDKTTLLGGPWASDVVDLDLAAVMPMGDGAWHTITLTPAGQGRIVALLRLA